VDGRRAGIALSVVTADGAATRKKEIAMKPKTTRKPSKQLKKGKKIESVKSLRIHVRKAGENPLDY
jgi:hypothetical protein